VIDFLSAAAKTNAKKFSNENLQKLLNKINSLMGKIWLISFCHKVENVLSLGA